MKRPKRLKTQAVKGDLVEHMCRRVSQILGDDGSDPRVYHWQPTSSTLLDLALSGGFGLPGGKVLEIFGREMSCKSGIALHVAASVLGANGIVLWLDPETGFSVNYATRVCGVDVFDPRFTYRAPSYAEDIFNMIRIASVEHAESEEGQVRPLLIVVDSIPALVTKPIANLAHGEGGQKATTASMLSNFFAKPWKQQILGSNVFIILINQVRSRMKALTRSQDDEWTTPGGHAIPFYAYGRLDLKSIGKIWNDPEASRDERISQGVMIQARVQKSKSVTPGDVVTFPFYTREGLPLAGIDDVRSCMSFLHARDCLGQSGSWFTFAGHKAQGLDNLWELVRADPSLSLAMQELTRQVFLEERGVEYTPVTEDTRSIPETEGRTKK